MSEQQSSSGHPDIPRYSIVVPVYNRPDEINELLASLVRLQFRDFEVIIVEDGSVMPCDHIINNYVDALTIRYFFKPNSGPGPSRNFGFERAAGAYFVVFDSDCIIPPHYLDAVEYALGLEGLDAWGGPDQGHENFTWVQQAMGYTMSSVLTTGGIRGGKKRVGAFQPRSFNMGLSRAVFSRTKGFAFTHFAEDIELSIRMVKEGFKVGLIPEAFVYHKRRATFSQFFRQVFSFGRGRAHVGARHAGEIKIAHWVPAFFVMGIIALLLLPLFSLSLFALGASLLGFYLLCIAVHGAIVTRNVMVGLLSVPSSLIQLVGYGVGFLAQRLGFIR